MSETTNSTVVCAIGQSLNLPTHWHSR